MKYARHVYFYFLITFYLKCLDILNIEEKDL